MKIYVRQEHIKRGRKADIYECPVALALKEQTKVKYVRVGLNTVRIGLWDTHLLKKVKNFIKRFDSSRKVNPFSFVLKGI